MKLFHKTKDERVIAEVNRVYKIGFFALTFGILADLLLQTANVHFTVVTPFTSVNALEFVLLLAVNLLCVLLLARRGLMDDNAYAEADRYPFRHYLGLGLLIGVAAAAGSVVSQYHRGAPWIGHGGGTAIAAVGILTLFTVLLTTALMLLITYAAFRYARHRRARAAGEEREK